jgi:hypothetical protein
MSSRAPEKLVARLRLLAAELEDQRRPVLVNVVNEAASMIEELSQERQATLSLDTLLAEW